MDWQTLITLAIGAGALVYVARRWWPAAVGLIKRPSGTGDAQATCGQPAAGDAGAASCGSACGQCGSSAPSKKDHRVHVVRHTRG